MKRSDLGHPGAGMPCSKRTTFAGSAWSMSGATFSSAKRGTWRSCSSSCEAWPEGARSS